MGEPCKKIIVLGVGNVLLKDEGIGVYVVKKLKESSHPLSNVGVDFIDAGTSAPDIIQNFEDNIEKLIIVDTAKMGAKPGTAVRLDYDELIDAAASGDYKELPLMLNDISVIEALNVASIMGNSPLKTVFIGIEPKETGAGIGISPEVELKMPDIIRIVSNEITEGPNSDYFGTKTN